MQPFLSFSEILEEVTLAPFQSHDTLRALALETAVVVADTGTGKTLIMAALIRALLNEVPNRRFIVLVEKSQLQQTPAKLRRWTGENLLHTTAAAENLSQVFEQQDPLRFPILMLTHDVLKSEKAMQILYRYKDSYDGLLIDEVHKLSNFPKSQSGAMAKAMLKNFRFKYGFTATPVTTKPEQLAYLSHMFDPENVDDVSEIVSRVKSGVKIDTLVPDLFIIRTRRDLGIEGTFIPHVEWIEPHDWQLNLPREQKVGSVFARNRKTGSYNQANAQRDIILKHKKDGKRGLVFVHHQESREFLCKILDETNIRYACVNGDVSGSEREEIYDAFARGFLDVVLTSITTGVDLDCEYICFYEYTAHIQQMLGRGHRGLNPKTLELHFLFTKYVGEVEYFEEKLYVLALWIETVLGQSYKAILHVGRNLSA